MTAADWMARSHLDDLRDEARDAALTASPYVEHPPSCFCRDCQLDVYAGGSGEHGDESEER
jgi:hypothetical protein